MWRKKLSYGKTRADFKSLFTEKYHDIPELKCINATQESFHGVNMDMIIKDNISEALDNLLMDTISEKDVFTQLTSTIK